MIKMKALRSFGTKKANEGHVRRGREFDVESEIRAKELEHVGHAYRIDTKAQTPLQNKMEQPPSNKAAEAGPLDSPGGMIGTDLLAPSSHPGLPRPTRRGRQPSSRSADESQS